MKILAIPQWHPLFKCLFVLIGLAFAFMCFPLGDDKTAAVTTDNIEESAAVNPNISPVAIEEKDFFADYRSKRQGIRSEKEELYQKFLADDSLTAEDKKVALSNLETLYLKNSIEDKVEIILKGRNYKDVIFSLEEPLSLLIIKSETLDEAQINELSDFIRVYCGVTADKLSVFPVGSPNG
ncbi:MAG: SpoIIIAH-like family protein [Clostridiales bacterium]